MADLTPITMPARLIELREQVLARSTKRMPKWKFRLAHDVVMMLQPKVEANLSVWDSEYGEPGRSRVPVSLRFAGEIRMQDGADAKAFSSSKKDRRDDEPHMSFKFEIVTRSDDAASGWTWWLSRNGRSGRLGPEWAPKSAFGDGVNTSKRVQELDRLENLVQKVLTDALADGTFNVVDVEVMLTTQCLVCGKALTDPASMARYIGPECAGTSSIHVPRVHHVKAGATDLKVESAWDAIPRLKKEATIDEMMDDLLARNRDEPDGVDDDIPPIELDPVRVKAGEECAGAFVDTANTMLSKHDHDITMRGMSLAAAQCLQNQGELEHFIKRLRHTFVLKQMMEDMEDEDELEEA
jgi:uncharacterized protein DUF6011